jgi:hypothetical protein
MKVNDELDAPVSFNLGSEHTLFLEWEAEWALGWI